MTDKTVNRKRRILANVLTGVLVLGAVGGGVAYTAVTVDGADRTAPTVAWADPTATATPADPAAGFDRGRGSTPLSKLLLPVPDGYALGADIDGEGNDHEVSAEEAVAVLKRTNKGFYGKERRAYEKSIDKLGIKGMAMRSYASRDNLLHVEVFVLRMKDKKSVRQLFETQKDLAEVLDLAKGPKIKDHAKNTACFVLPDPPKPTDPEDEEQWDDRLRGLTCSAYDGEVLVSASSAGADEHHRRAVADLLEKQLSHIESPGEYV
ncbi:hypothetical protein [Streptomyces narbonensis]|uniref:hypothetical protein n=1 Tax=Streptomyces narbonensis TaxID=67333 RepID=UPI001678F3F5|nr:hypothetical protein [Streptomyces narbonensis]GGV98116.1 hypothetical protein GCM10010230_20950 [Streptomyces narbonensis]